MDAKDALEVRRQNGGVAKSPIADDIKSMEKQFQLAMPKGAEAQQLIRDALTCLRTTPKLAECDSPSVLGALMTVAQLGLRVGVLGQAWPLPFWDKNARGFRAQLIIGYRGYGELAHRSPKVQSFIPRIVYANDEFDIDYGVAGTLVHRPATGPRGVPIGYHSIARYSNGGYDFLYMTRAEVEEHRDKFATTRRKDGTIFGPWVDHFDAMAQKTPQRLLAKYIPMSPDLERGTIVDGGLRIDLNPRNLPEEVTEPLRVIDAAPETDEGPDLSGKITEPQRKKMMAIATQMGLDRDQRLAYIAQIVGRDVASSNDLTGREAAAVLDAMDRWAQQEAGPK